MKRPSFQFYPSDWRKDTALQFCSLAARGLWVEMMCIAHECHTYGHLSVSGRPMTPAQIGRLVGISEKECIKLLAELFDAGVPSKTDEGVIFSRRMVRDELARERRAAGGHAGAEHGIKGASHGIKGGRPVKQMDGEITPLDEQGRGVIYPPNKPPPSSSSSSSPTSSKSKAESAPATRLPADWTPSQIEYEFCVKERPDLAPNDVADRFRDYWVAVPGAKGRKSDWLATWRNWVRNERGGGGNGKNGSSRTSIADTLAELTGRNRNPSPVIDGVAARVD